MFGYVTIYKDELLVREFNEYKSVYCGLCRTLGTEYSKLSRFILSYDCTFYALLLLSLNGECPGYEKKMCRCNPLKKGTYIKNGEDALSKASALSVVSVYFKIVDNISDSKGIKKLAYKFLKPIAKKWANKAKEKYPYIYNAVETMSKEQFIVESMDNVQLDMSADPTAKMLRTVLSYEEQDKSRKLILETMGYNLGRWIYLMDAADDLEEDREKNNYNPFLLMDYNGEKNFKNYISQILNQSLAQAYNAFELLDITLYKGIIDNILLKGLAQKQRTVLFSEEKNGNKSV